jgi:hypothetical protein
MPGAIVHVLQQLKIASNNNYLHVSITTCTTDQKQHVRHCMTISGIQNPRAHMYDVAFHKSPLTSHGESHERHCSQRCSNLSNTVIFTAFISSHKVLPLLLSQRLPLLPGGCLRSLLLQSAPSSPRHARRAQACGQHTAVHLPVSTIARF